MDKLEKNTKCGKIFVQDLKNEFQLSKFRLSHEPTEDFFQCQWQNNKHSPFWFVYRWCLAIFFTMPIIINMIGLDWRDRWFITLENWTFFLCMMASIFGAILVTFYYFEKYQIVGIGWILQIFWLSHFCSVTLAFFVSVVYFAFLRDQDANNVMTLIPYGLNSLLMLLDHMLVAFPTRLLHSVYPLALLMCYIIFSAFYYSIGGLSPYNQDAVYTVLDWSEPNYAMETVCAAIFLLLALEVIVFYLYKLRKFIYDKYSK